MKTHKEPSNQTAEQHATAFDVVCGMEVDQTESHHHVQHHGAVYYFCSSHCKKHFVDAPTRYVWEK